MSSPSSTAPPQSSLPFPSFPARSTKRRRRRRRWRTGGERGGSFPCKNSIPLGIEVSKTRMGIYITHSHLAYLPNKGFSRPPPLPTSQASSTPRHPRSIKRAREVSARQSLGMTMLIPRMNAS